MGNARAKLFFNRNCEIYIGECARWIHFKVKIFKIHFIGNTVLVISEQNDSYQNFLLAKKDCRSDYNIHLCICNQLKLAANGVLKNAAIATLKLICCSLHSPTPSWDSTIENINFCLINWEKLSLILTTSFHMLQSQITSKTTQSPK